MQKQRWGTASDGSVPSHGRVARALRAHLVWEADPPTVKEGSHPLGPHPCWGREGSGVSPAAPGHASEPTHCAVVATVPSPPA